MKIAKFYFQEKGTDKILRKRIQELKDSLSKDFISEKESSPKKLEHKERIQNYQLDIVGEDVEQAIEIAKKIESGILKSENLCNVFQTFCEGNKGLSRDKMPQIEANKSLKDLLASKQLLEREKAKAIIDAGGSLKNKQPILQQILSSLKEESIKIIESRISVGKLKATQREIKAVKVFEMADKFLKGKFENIDDSIIVSKDGFILDGHHRWAALLTINPMRKIKIKIIDMKMDKLLEKVLSFPGVYKESFDGKRKKSKSASLTAKKRNYFLKKAKWSGIKRVPFNVGKLTQIALNEVLDQLEISEYVFQKTMNFYAKQMGGTYYDGVIKLKSAPYEIYVHYLKYNEDMVVPETERTKTEGPIWEPYVSWIVYPKGQKNRSKMFKIFESPMEGSKQVWPQFKKWMEIIVEVVNQIRFKEDVEVFGLDKFSNQRSKNKSYECNRKNRI